MKEYEFHRAAIDKLDAQRLQIRNWAITLAGALFAVSVTAQRPTVAFGGLATTVLFAWLEVVYMMMQGGVIARSNKLESLVDDYRLRGVDPVHYEFGVSHAYRGNFYWTAMASAIFRRGRIHLWGFYLGLMTVMATAAVAINLWQ